MASSDAPPDPYLWLEEITGDRAMQWVHEQNARTTRELEAQPDFQPIRERLLSILDSKEKIPYVEKYGQFYYNFWRDGKNVRGLWRRTTLDEYKKPQSVWETVIDVDQLAAGEKENWVFEGVAVLKPDLDRCLVSLSRGGADAKVVREFDLKTKSFVADGFALPEAKTQVTWKDRDDLYVSTDFGPGSLTTSGYPRLVKLWQRGIPLAQATTVLEGKVDDVHVTPEVVHDHGHVYELINRSPTFFTDEVYIRRGDQWVHIDKPPDAELDTFAGSLLLRLRSDWNNYPSGSLLAADFDAYLSGDHHFTQLFKPTERTSLASISATKNYLILNMLDNVRSRPLLLSPANHSWVTTSLNAPAFGTAEATGIDADESDDYFLNTEDFLTPPSLYLGTAGVDGRELLKQLPSFFNTDGLEIAQYEATSSDGTKVPYFQISRKGLKLDGTNLTLLYGYGGFEISLTPTYSGSLGASWLERGGVYVLANIRGGGEFGPNWHNAARKEHRQRAYDDFIAVAQSLIFRQVTSPKHLGIRGGSNGGLLMGVMLTERPDLFGAVVCQSPLLDMRRFNKLSAGASWMDEYGNPDKPEDWAYISQYSPYQNIAKDRVYPPVLITTSTRDDRVHPGHARKMAARLEEDGHEVLYYENTEGGHAAAANNKEIAYMNALAYSFLLKELQ